MLIPYRSESDPEVQGEGSIDPLGLATVADHLADWIMPGITARMWRPRFLTAMVVASTVVQPLQEALAKDGITPAWLIFEWHYVEPMARREDKDGNLRRIPGIEKARQSVRDKIPMNPDRYLKTPKVFGFHGVYKRLAVHTSVVDSHLCPSENGARLLKTWEREQGLSGFSDWDCDEGLGPKLRRSFFEAIKHSMESGQSEKRGPWSGASLIVNHLAPDGMGKQEAQCLWELLLDSQAEPRSEIFKTLRDVELLSLFSDCRSERKLLREFNSRVSNELRRRISAIEAYEAFCRPLQEVMDRLRYLSTIRRPALVQDRDLEADERTSELAAKIQQSVDHARESLNGSPVEDEFEKLGRSFDEVRTGAELFHALWDHHVKIQGGKPPEGKRPWFEEMGDGGLIVRPPYRMDEEPEPREEYVHPYRLFAAESFIRDLRPLTDGKTEEN